MKNSIILLARLIAGLLFTQSAAAQNEACILAGQILSGIAVNLPPSGEAPVQACMFSRYGCDNPGGFSYSFSADPLDTEMIVTCQDLGQLEINIWIWDAAGNSTTSSGFIVVQDLLSACPGSGSACSPVVVLQYGLVLSIGGNGTAVVSARQFDAGTYLSGCDPGQGFSFSFSPDPADSIKTFVCDNDLGVSIVQIWVTAESGQQALAESVAIVQTPDGDCGAVQACTPQITGILGISVQLSSAQEVVLSPDLFILEVKETCPGGGEILLSFSSDPGDSKISYGCNEADFHVVPIWATDALGNHSYIELGFRVEDLAGVCDNPVTIAFSPTDQACDAGGADLTPYIGAGPICLNNIEATAEPGEVAPPQGDCLAQNAWCDGGIVHNSVWFTVTAPSTGNLRIETDGVLDMQLAVWQAGSCEDLLSGNAQLMGANDSRSGDPHGNAALEVGLSPGEQYFIQADGHGIAETGLFYLTLTELTGLREAPAGLEFALMPNPASGSVSVLFSGEITEEGHFTLFNAVGERIRSERIAPGLRAHPIDIGGLPPGIYFCHLSAGNKRHGLKKLIIL
jgi:hypothetical protein